MHKEGPTPRVMVACLKRFACFSSHGRTDTDTASSYGCMPEGVCTFQRVALSLACQLEEN